MGLYRRRKPHDRIELDAQHVVVAYCFDDRYQYLCRCRLKLLWLLNDRKHDLQRKIWQLFHESNAL